MNLSRPTNRFEPTVPSTKASSVDFDELMMSTLEIYVTLPILSIPPFIAFMGLVALTSNRLWTFLRALVWEGLLAYISWVAAITLFLSVGSTVKHVVLVVFMIFFGIQQTALLLLIILSLPLGYVLLHVLIYAVIVLCLVFTLLEYLVILGQKQPDVLLGLLVAVIMVGWRLSRTWEWYWEDGPGAAHLVQAEEDWEDEQPLGVIINEEFDEEEWLADGLDWWENLVWRHFVW